MRPWEKNCSKCYRSTIIGKRICKKVLKDKRIIALILIYMLTGNSYAQ